MAMMKAVRMHSYGGPEVLVLEDVPRPVPAAGEILIRVHAAAVDPLDWKVREGHARDWLGHRLPLIIGWDVSGVVEALGPGAAGFPAGEEVIGLLDFSRDGGYAEYALCRPAAMAGKPRTVAHVQAASIPIAGLTAWQTLFDVGQLAPGQRVLVHGAGGAVGGFAVQFAALREARVTALTGADQLQEVAALGAEQVFDYGAGRFEDSVGEQDLVLDVIGGAIQERSLKLLRKGGILVSTVGVSAAGAAAARGVKAKPFMVQPNAAQLAEIASLVDAGKLRLNVGTVLPLAQARTAHELVQSGRSRGKVVLQVRQD